MKENKKNCKLKVEGKEKELSNYILINNNENKNIILIKLFGINKVQNFNRMFYFCKSLLYIFYRQYWNINNNNDDDIKRVINKYSSLRKLPDINIK